MLLFLFHYFLYLSPYYAYRYEYVNKMVVGILVPQWKSVNLRLHANI